LARAVALCSMYLLLVFGHNHTRLALCLSFGCCSFFWFS